MQPPVVEFRNVSKSFSLTLDQPRSLKSLLVSLCSGEFFKLQTETKHVLRNVSFAIQRGETVGIMGRNGTGKSTLLRMLCGIYKPNQGEIVVRQRIAPLIALGAGFHHDLTGYENIFLNGAIMGIPREDLVRSMDAIIDFSGLGQEIYKPVKHYSSGMMMRLGFSIAAHVDAPILVLDEVLAVGDDGFQRKCFAKLRELFKEGRTMILVTHDPSQVLEYCKRCLVIEDGYLVYDGAAKEGTERYLGLFRPEPTVPAVDLASL